MGGLFGGFGGCNNGCNNGCERGFDLHIDCCTLIMLMLLLGQSGCGDMTWLLLILLLCGNNGNHNCQ